MASTTACNPLVCCWSAPSISIVRGRHIQQLRIRSSTTDSVSSTAAAIGGRREMVDCVIVGGGISGLCIAHALATKHKNFNIVVTEARDRVGGNITTRRGDDGYLWEEGPNSFQLSDPVLTMAVDSGLKDELVFGDPDAPRFVYWGGKLRPVPSKPTDLSFLFDEHSW